VTLSRALTEALYEGRNYYLIVDRKRVVALQQPQRVDYAFLAWLRTGLERGYAGMNDVLQQQGNFQISLDDIVDVDYSFPHLTLMNGSRLYEFQLRDQVNGDMVGKKIERGYRKHK
jgi:hypothetical protein